MVDSTADLPLEIIEKYNIKVIPLTVHFGDEEFLDKVDITPNEFYNKLKTTGIIPKTSQVTPERFVKAFKRELDKGNKVICITIGSNASGTCQSAYIAKEELNTEDIIIIDSNMLCMGIGYLAIIVAKMIEKEKSIEDIIEVAKTLSNNKIEQLFCVDTLEYLKKGGRIKGSKAVVAEILNIKPILNVHDAITQTIGKVRGRKKVIPYYLKHINATMDIEQTDFIVIAHSQDEQFAIDFSKKFQEEFTWNKEIIFSEVGAIIGTHAGPGVLAVFYIKK
jgi:DegV family protein with EDD domain